MKGPLPPNILRRMSVEDRRPLGKAGRTTAECEEVKNVRLERELHKLINNELNRMGIFPVHSRTDKRTTQQKGVPDFIMAVRGPFKVTPLAVEVKLPYSDLTKEQEDVRKDMIANGWSYFVVRSFDEFRSVMKLFA